MKVFVLGATGQTGKEAVKLALEKGWQVVAAVRDTTKLNDTCQSPGGDRLKVEKANIFDSASMVPLMRGCDAVISCLGPSGFYHVLPWTHCTFYSDSIKHISAAMKEAGVLRILFVSSWCTVYKPEHPKVLEWFLKPAFLGRILADMDRMERYLEGEADINFTSVRPPGLSNAAAAGSVIVVEGQFHPESQYQMSRTDVATWMLDNIGADQWARKYAAIGVA